MRSLEQATMRRLITVAVLIIGLFLGAALLAAQDTSVPSIFGRRDTQNHVICYSARPGSDFLSCVYVPPDGTQVNGPQRVAPEEPKTT